MNLHRPSLTEALTVMRSHGRESCYPHLWNGLVFAQNYQLNCQPFDLSGYGNNGTLTNMDASNWTPEELTFSEPTATTVGITVAGLESPWAGDCTIQFRIKPKPSSAARTILAQGDTAKTKWIQININWDNTVFHSFDDDILSRAIWSTTGTVADNEWSTYTVTKAASGFSSYINGEADVTYGARGDCGSTEDLMIGIISYNATYGWLGGMSYVAFWNRVLSPAEIRILADDSFALTRQRPRMYSMASGEAPPATFDPQWAQHCNNIIGAC